MYHTLLCLSFSETLLSKGHAFFMQEVSISNFCFALLKPMTNNPFSHQPYVSKNLYLILNLLVKWTQRKWSILQARG